MKKSAKLKFLSLATLVFAGVFGGAAGTVAWFTTNVHIEEANMLLTGDALGAYFEYGDGTDEKPYGIKTVRQLYNLSWLQYLGYFNPTKEEGYPYSGRWTEAMKKVYGNDFNQKPHFELAGDIDFSNKDASSIGINGMPPIGTTAFPFEGFFDGRGYTISHGVFSTSSGDFGIKPLAVTTYNADTNVGVFGKVSGAETSIKDLGISSPLVKSTLADTVIGAAIGDAGTAQYSNIAVDDPTLRIGNGTSTSNLSDYGLVGKIDASQTHQVQIVDNTLSTVKVAEDTFTIPNQGSENSWGGSINMKAMFDRLDDIYENYSPDPTTYDTAIPLKKARTYNYEGTFLSETVTGTATYSGDSSLGVRRYNPLIGNAYNEKLGNYQMNRRDIGNLILYLSGGYWGEDRTEYKHIGYQITDGTNYLDLYPGGTNNLRNLTSGTSKATLWEMPEAGHSGTIKAAYNGTTYYLYNDNGTLKAGNTQTNWTVTESNGYRYIESGDNQLVYLSGWKVSPKPTYLKQNKNGTDYYLSRNGNSISTVTDVNGAAEWYVDSDNYLFFYNGSTPYYIAYDQSFSTSKTSGSWTTNYSFRLDANNHLYGVTNPFFGSTQYKFLTLSSTTYAFSSPSTSSKAPDGAATLAFERGKINSTTATSSLTGSGPDYATSNAGMRYDGDDVTFFPLGAKETPTDGSATHDEGLYEALFQNTGYVVGGYNYTSEPSKYDRTDPTIRVAEYAGATDYIKNYNGSGFTNVLTVDENNTVQEINESSNNYEKYADSKDAFLKILGQSSGNLYGLHFMQADINKDYLVTAPYARINGEPYDDYQMPANSIDFRLKQKGYVNFFAGSYMSGYTVDSFFSLHRIIRDSEDESTIESIEEIEEVYSDYDEDDLKTSSHSYIYRVKDKENSTPSTTVWKYTRPYRLDSMGQRVEIEKDAQGQNVPYAGGYLSEDDFAELTDYYSVFNTSRIKKNTLTQNQCYYFEVPVNEGEYCLGSVSNGTAGGYLLYLDIGANAQKNNRTEVYEKFVRTVSLSSYVENFVLVESASTVMAALITTDPQGARVRKEGAADLNAADSIAFRVKAGQAGDVVIERESNVITLSRSGPPDTEITYAAHGMTLREQTGESAYSAISLVTETPTETIFNRLTLLDWDASNSVATVTTITDETGQSRLIAQTKGGETVATPVVYKGTNYGDAAGNAFSADELAALDITYSPASTIMEFDYYAEAATTIATDFALQSNLDEETGFFTLNGYEFDITRTGSANFTAYVTKTTATITVVIDEQNVQYTFTYKINGTSVTAPTTVLINRAPAN